MLGPSRLGKRGVTASRHLTWSAGCGGREARYDEAWIADGEIVRSRSPDAGINPRAWPGGTVARQPGAPRRSRISR